MYKIFLAFIQSQGKTIKIKELWAPSINIYVRGPTVQVKMQNKTDKETQPRVTAFSGLLK